jgi:integrase
VSPRNRGARERLWTNVYQDDVGISAVARVKGCTPRELRFKHGTKKADILETARAEMRQTARRRQAAIASGSFAADAEAFTRTLPKTPGRAALLSNVAAWVAKFGQRRRQDLTLDDFRDLMKAWADAGAAAPTLNHRRRALVQIFEHHEGSDPPVLPRRLKYTKPKKRPARGQSMALMDAIIRAMPDRPVRRPGRRAVEGPSGAKARLWMMLWTGVSQTTLEQLHPRDVDLEAHGGQGAITLPPREKGAGAPGVRLPLIPGAKPAVQYWLRALAVGRFDRRVHARSLRAARKAYATRQAAAGAPVSLPPSLRPYDLRHTFLSHLARLTRGNGVVLKRYAQHLDIRTTEQYIEAAMDDVVLDALFVAPARGPKPPREEKSREI